MGKNKKEKNKNKKKCINCAFLEPKKYGTFLTNLDKLRDNGVAPARIGPSFIKYFCYIHHNKEIKKPQQEYCRFFKNKVPKNSAKEEYDLFLKEKNIRLQNRKFWGSIIISSISLIISITAIIRS